MITKMGARLGTFRDARRRRRRQREDRRRQKREVRRREGRARGFPLEEGLVVA